MFVYFYKPWFWIGLQRILIWPDILQIFLLDILYPIGLVFNKSAYISLLYIDIILIVKTVFYSRISGFSATGYPVFRPAEYPANKTGYPANETEYPAGYPVQPTFGSSYS